MFPISHFNIMSLLLSIIESIISLEYRKKMYT